ncbi:AraC family transcriptional regulator [Clostridiaceae bacterium]|nr:AraC family transcriptional regulator [Clostridiaceae bacterium]
MNDICTKSVNLADESERVAYNRIGYPAYIRRDRLSHYPNYSAVSHWHEDLELITVLSGRMLYNVNGTVFDITEGNGIFVNGRQFHHGYSADRSECEFICIVFHPLLLCVNEYFADRYVRPVMEHGGQPCITLQHAVLWQRQVMDILREICRCAGTKEDLLMIQKLLFDLWIPLYRHFPADGDRPIRPNRQLAAVKQMVSYIQEHYREALSLDQIAAAGNVCKSGCSALFRKYLSRPPVAYLNEYRLSRSLELLLQTDMSILEISYEVGFHHASYFSEIFRKCYHCTPREYVKRHKGMGTGAGS